MLSGCSYLVSLEAELRRLETEMAERPDDGALLDLNHPLAGETLHFNIEIVGLRRATSDEIAHGHVHTAGHTH